MAKQHPPIPSSTRSQQLLQVSNPEASWRSQPATSDASSQQIQLQAMMFDNQPRAVQKIVDNKSEDSKGGGPDSRRRIDGQQRILETYGLLNKINQVPITHRNELKKQHSHESAKKDSNRHQAKGTISACFNVKELPSPKDHQPLDGSDASSGRDNETQESCNTLKLKGTNSRSGSAQKCDQSDQSHSSKPLVGPPTVVADRQGVILLASKQKRAIVTGKDPYRKGRQLLLKDTLNRNLGSPGFSSTRATKVVQPPEPEIKSKLQQALLGRSRMAEKQLSQYLSSMELVNFPMEFFTLNSGLSQTAVTSKESQSNEALTNVLSKKSDMGGAVVVNRQALLQHAVGHDETTSVSSSTLIEFPMKQLYEGNQSLKSTNKNRFSRQTSQKGGSKSQILPDDDQTAPGLLADGGGGGGLDYPSLLTAIQKNIQGQDNSVVNKKKKVNLKNCQIELDLANVGPKPAQHSNIGIPQVILANQIHSCSRNNFRQMYATTTTVGPPVPLQKSSLSSLRPLRPKSRNSRQSSTKHKQQHHFDPIKVPAILADANMATLDSKQTDGTKLLEAASQTISNPQMYPQQQYPQQQDELLRLHSGGNVTLGNSMQSIGSASQQENFYFLGQGQTAFQQQPNTSLNNQAADNSHQRPTLVAGHHESDSRIPVRTSSTLPPSISSKHTDSYQLMHSSGLQQNPNLKTTEQEYDDQQDTRTLSNSNSLTANMVVHGNNKFKQSLLCGNTRSHKGGVSTENNRSRNSQNPGVRSAIQTMQTRLTRGAGGGSSDPKKVAQLVRALNSRSHKHLDSYAQDKFLRTFCSSEEYPQTVATQQQQNASQSYRIRLKRNKKLSNQQTKLSKAMAKKSLGFLKENRQNVIVKLGEHHSLCQMGMPLLKLVQLNSTYEGVSQMGGRRPTEPMSRVSSAMAERSRIGGLYIINPTTLSSGLVADQVDQLEASRFSPLKTKQQQQQQSNEVIFQRIQQMDGSYVESGGVHRDIVSNPLSASSFDRLQLTPTARLGLSNKMLKDDTDGPSSSRSNGAFTIDSPDRLKKSKSHTRVGLHTKPQF